jgi:alkylation response protein AidB-like acyl-CoA dehydrogenase
MQLADTDEQRDLREHLSSFFAKESTPERVRAAEPLGFDPHLWEQVVAMGLPVMAVPESQGGGEASLSDLALTAEEFGRRIGSVPLVETAVTANLLAALAREKDGAAAEVLLAEAGDGAVITLALRPPVGGTARLVPAGAVADAVVVLDGDRLIALGKDETVVRPEPANLGSSPLADWPTAEGGRVLASGEAARRAYERARAEWQTLTSAALVGLASSALEMGVEYVKQRKAFGVRIGWFQSVQHGLADAATAVDGARLLAYEAAWAFDEDPDRAPALASMALLFAVDSAFSTAAKSLHYHGGYGYTLEYDIQLYFRRAKAWSLAAGDPRREYQRLASLLFENEGAN